MLGAPLVDVVDFLFLFLFLVSFFPKFSFVAHSRTHKIVEEENKPCFWRGGCFCFLLFFQTDDHVSFPLCFSLFGGKLTHRIELKSFDLMRRVRIRQLCHRTKKRMHSTTEKTGVMRVAAPPWKHPPLSIVVDIVPEFMMATQKSSADANVEIFFDS